MRYLVALLLFVSGAQATWAPKDGEVVDPAVSAWFQKQVIMPAAQKRLAAQGITWEFCCDHADRLRTRFVAGIHNDEWYYWDETAKRYLVIQADTVHPYDPTMPTQLQTEGVLMIYQGIVTCFWPPEGGL